MPISRSQMPRQMYGLGSFVKSIGKGIKKIVKSPIGKAAIMAGIGFGIPGTSIGGLFGRASIGGAAPGIFGFGGIGNALGAAKGSLFGKTIMGGNAAKGAGYFKPGLLSGITGSKAGLGILGASALSGLFAGKSEEEVSDLKRNPTALRGYLSQYYKNLNQDASDTEVNEFVESNMAEYKADGGRIGYADGTEEIVQPSASMMVDTTTSNPIPDDADRQSAAEIAKVMMATRDLPREEGEIEDTETMSTKQFMTEQYLMPKVKQLVENFGISKIEALKMVRDEMMKFVKPAKANGGRMGYAYGSDNLVEQASGIEGLDVNINPKGVKELDLRDSGGFIPPVGVKEKADDIPAMLSNNEFVFTADAVRGMGDGNVNKGAQRMYDMMKKLENGGRV
jgi:hypothetical protein